MIARDSSLWHYLSDYQRILFEDGEFLIEDSIRHKDREPTDYSYLVFPYAKLYEGFLKDVFLDIRIIDAREYKSIHYRIGRALSENLVRRLRNRSAYGQIKDRFGEDLARELWHTWKQGRNLVFHFFPDSVRMLTRDQAVEIIQMIIHTMEKTVEKTHVRRNT